MADKTTATKIVLGVVLLAVLKLVGTIILQIVRVTANVLVYFGLYVPFFYLLWGAVLSILGAFSFAVLSVNAILFYIGLALCMGVAVCIFVRNYGRKPVSTVTRGSSTAIRSAAQNVHRTAPRRREVTNAPDRPLYMYYSEDNPYYFVHEYADHFDIYYDDGVNPIRFHHSEEKPSTSES